MTIAQLMQRPVRVGSYPFVLCSEAVAVTKDAALIAGGLCSLVSRSLGAGVASATRLWMLPELVGMATAAHQTLVDPSIAATERAYAAASTDYVEDARRVMDVLRSAAADEADRFTDPLASPLDDVVRHPRPLPDRAGAPPRWFDHGEAVHATSA